MHCLYKFRLLVQLHQCIGMEAATHLRQARLAGRRHFPLQTGQQLREMILEKGLLTEEEVKDILDPFQMTSPGIAGEKYLLNQ